MGTWSVQTTELACQCLGMGPKKREMEGFLHRNRIGLEFHDQKWEIDEEIQNQLRFVKTQIAKLSNFLTSFHQLAKNTLTSSILAKNPKLGPENSKLSRAFLLRI